MAIRNLAMILFLVCTSGCAAEFESAVDSAPAPHSKRPSITSSTRSTLKQRLTKLRHGMSFADILRELGLSHLEEDEMSGIMSLGAASYRFSSNDSKAIVSIVEFACGDLWVIVEFPEHKTRLERMLEAD